jgi:hypothetical protein
MSAFTTDDGVELAYRAAELVGQVVDEILQLVRHGSHSTGSEEDRW